MVASLGLNVPNSVADEGFEGNLEEEETNRGI